jgi:phosphoglycerate dehydrogenase-like enzyme
MPFDVICVMRERTPLSREIIDRLPQLKLIASTARRNASIDMAAAEERGIRVTGTGYRSTPTIEMTWALILARACCDSLESQQAQDSSISPAFSRKTGFHFFAARSSTRQIVRESNAVRRGGWQMSIGRELSGRTLGVLGLGNIGAQVARIGLAFGMKVIAWSQNMTAGIAEVAGATFVEKEELFREADIVTIHLVLSARTLGLIGAAELALMKPASWLVNTSRGPIVDEGALIRALESRAIAGAAIDVFSIEPLPVDHPFRRLDNMLATPHVGYVAEDLYRTFYGDTAAAVAAWLDEMADSKRT